MEDANPIEARPEYMPNGPVQQPPGYEFTERQNSVVSGLGTAMIILSIVWYASGILVILGGALSLNIVMFILGFFVVSLGHYLRMAFLSMRRIVNTQGNDIPQLIEAVDNLASYFKTIGIFAILGIVIAGIVVLVAGS